MRDNRENRIQIRTDWKWNTWLDFLLLYPRQNQSFRFDPKTQHKNSFQDHPPTSLLWGYWPNYSWNIQIFTLSPFFQRFSIQNFQRFPLSSNRSNSVNIWARKMFFLSKPKLNQNSIQPNITLSWVRHENDFAHHSPHTTIMEVDIWWEMSPWRGL